MQFVFEKIGTRWQIDINKELTKKEGEELLSQIISRIDIFDKDYSRFRADSLVTEISNKAGEYILPADAEPMMKIYKELHDLSEGKMTPLIGQLISDAGYDANYSLKGHGELRSPRPWDEVLEYNHPKLLVKEPVLLDFGAAGKGYLIDLVFDVIKAYDIDDFIVDAGGDILHRSQNPSPFKVGLENPLNFKEVIGVLNLNNQSLAASAGSRRKWEGYHHIINPITKKSVEEILATWVIADSTLLADALSTALFFMAGNKLISKYNFEYLVLRDDFSIDVSSEFPAEIFKSQS